MVAANTIPCSMCDGAGRMASDFECPHCSGTGIKVPEWRRTKSNIMGAPTYVNKSGAVCVDISKYKRDK